MADETKFVLGLLLALLSLPSLLSAWVDRRIPYVAVIMMLVAAALIVPVWLAQPGGIPLREWPGMIINVIAKIIR